MESKKFLCNKVARTYNYYDTFTNESDLLKAMRRDIRLAQVWGTNMANVRSIYRCRKQGFEETWRVSRSPGWVKYAEAAVR